MKKFLWTVCILCSLSQIVIGADPNRDLEAFRPYEPISHTEIRESVKAYAFYLGRMYLADKLMKKFPSFRSQISQAILTAENSPYAQGAKNLGQILDKAYPEDMKQSKDDLYKLLGKESQNYSKDMIPMLVELFRKGEICLPEEQTYCNTLLRFNNRLNGDPELYFQLGLIKRITTAGHPKSQSLEITFDVPVNWVQKEGRRPHVLWRFSGPPYRGMMPQLIVTVSDPIPNFETLLKDYRPEEIFHDEEVISEITSGIGTIHSIKKTFLDKQPALLVVHTQKAERLGTEIKVKYLTLLLLVEDKMVSMMAGLGTGKEYETNLDKEFNIYQPLFMSILSSTVVMSRYR